MHRWKESGLTAKEFCAREGIHSPGTLFSWQYQLLRRAKQAPRVKVAPQELKLVRLTSVDSKSHAATGKPSEISIVCGSYRIAVSTGFDEALLERVLTVLERAR